MSDVEFTDEDRINPPAAERDEPTGGALMQFFIRHGLAKSEKSATTALAVVGVLAFLLAVYFFFF